MIHRRFCTFLKYLTLLVCGLIGLLSFQNCSGLNALNPDGQFSVLSSSAVCSVSSLLPLPTSTPWIPSRKFTTSDESAGNLDGYILGSTGVSVTASYATCPNIARKIDLYRMVNGNWIVQNRCYINSSASSSTPNSGYCSYRQPLSVGQSVNSGEMFIRIWNIESDCQTYADEAGNVNGYKDFPVSGTIQDETTYDSVAQARSVLIQKPSYKIKMDPHGGATFELYSLRNSQPQNQWVNSVHAHLGAALQVAIHSGALNSLTTQGCSGQGYYNPTQAGTACSYKNSVGAPAAPAPGDPTSGLNIQCDGVLNNSCTSANSQISLSLHRMMNFDYGPSYQGPYNDGDQMTFAQDMKAQDNFVEVEMKFRNTGNTFTGATEVPTYYFNNQFRKITYGDCAGAHTVIIPDNRSGDDAKNYSQILSHDEPLWITFTNNSGMTGADTYTLAWMYAPELEAAIDSTWIGRGSVIGETGTYHQIKFSNARNVTFVKNVTYRAKYVVFPFAANEIIKSRFGTMTVAATILRLRAEYAASQQ